MNDRAKEYKYIRRRFGIRLLSGLLGLVFFITTVGPVDSVFASVNPSVELSASPVLESLKSFRLPEAFGHIEETFEPSEQSPKIILIQDAHDIPDAQRSIRHILLFLQKQYGVRQVAVEGAAQKLDPQMFKSFPDKKLLSSVMRKLMDRGELSGSAAAAVMGTEGSAVEPDYFGVEDWPLYEKGLELYLEAMTRQKVAVRRLDLSWETLELAKQENYSKQLRDVDLAETQFRDNKKDLISFLEVLSALQPPTAQSEIALFLAEAKKQTASHTALELEVRRIAKDFKMRSEEWSPESRRLFNQQWQSFQTGDTHAEQFALSLNEIAGKEKIDITMSKRLLLGAANQKRLHDIEGTQFFKSIEDYTHSVKDALFVAAEDRELDRKTRALLLQKKLATLELSREEWDMVKAKVVDQNSDDGLPQDLFSAKSFYENAEKRDQALFDQLKKRAQLGSPLVMVAGGFHAQGLMERLRKAGLAYVLVMPNIQQLPETTNYRAHMQGDVSWKSYFKIEKGRINLYAPFVRYVRDELLKMARISEPLLKSWRDQLIRDMARQGRIEQVGGYTQYLDETLEKSKVIPQEGLAKLDRFFEGLRLLDREGRFKAPDILQLLKPASAVPSGPIAGALTHQSLAVAAMSRVPLRPDVAPAEISRSEVRAESAVFSKENVRIVIAEDMKIISGPLSVKLTGLGYRKVWTVSTLGELKAMMDSSEGLPEVLILDRHLENGEDAVKYIAQLRREGQLIGKDRGGTLVIWNSFTAPAEESAEVDLVTSGLYDGRPLSSMKGKLSPEAMGERLEQAMLILNSRPAAGEKDNLRAKVSSEFAPVSDDDRNRHEIIQSINSVLGNELTDKQGVKFRVELLPSTGLPVIPENAVSASLRLSHAAVQLDLSFDILPNLIRFSDQSLDLEDPIKRAMMMRLILEFAAKIQIPHGDLYLESIVEDPAALKALSLQMREKLLAILPGDSISQVPKKAAKEDLIALLDNYVGLPQGAHGIVVDPEKLMDGPYANSTPVWRLHDQFGLAHSLDVVGDPDKRQVVLVTRQINSRFVLHQLKGVLGTLTDLLIPSIESRNGIQDVMKKGGVLFEKVPVFYAELLDLDNLHAKKNVRESMEFVQKIYEAFSTAKIERTLRKLKSAFGEKISEADLEQIRTTALFVQDAAADWLGHKEDFFHEVSVEDFMKRVSQLAAPEGTDLVRFLMDDRVRKTRIEIMPQTLIEILINLVRNSRQAIEHYEQSLEGKAVVYVPEITVKAQKFKSTVRITVSDNGPGMTADQVEKANRGISFTSDYKPDSTGVGLPSSRNQIEGLFYGQWAVTSKLAESKSHGETAIVMSLPIRQPKRSEVRGFQITPRGKPSIDVRVKDFERALSLPIARGVRWKRLVTPREAELFDRDYHSDGRGEYTAVFDGIVYAFPVATFEKMKAWAGLSPDFERTGYLLARNVEGRNVIFDFKPMASLVIGLGASDVQRTNQMVYGLSDFSAMGIDPELASNLTVHFKRADGSIVSEKGFSLTLPDSLNFAKLPASDDRLSRLDWHSHYEASFYTNTPSPEDHRSAQAVSALYWVGDKFAGKEGRLIFYDAREGNHVLLESTRSEVRGLTPASPEAMWSQLKSVLAQVNQLFVNEALNNDWVSCGPASRTFARNLSELIPGATGSIVHVSKFRQESLHDPALFLTLQTLVELIRDFASERKAPPESLLGLIFGKTASHQTTVLQSVSENKEAEKTLEVISESSIRIAGSSSAVLLELLLAIKEKFSDESSADNLKRLARQLMFYPGGYPTPPMAPAMLPLMRIPSQYLDAFPMLSSPFESYGASRHIASLVHLDGRTHLVDLTVSQYDGMAYPVTQVLMIEDVTAAKLIEHGYILERAVRLEDINAEGIGTRDETLSYIPFVERVLAEQSAGKGTSDDAVQRSEVRTGAVELKGDEIRFRIRQAAGERKLLTGTGEDETRKAFELQMEMVRLRSVIHQSFHGIGDVHGGADAVKIYLETIPSDEVILQVGDMIDRGEDSPLAVERLRTAQKERESQDQAPIFKFIGNHEMMLLEGYLGNNMKLLNWYRELPMAERELIFGVDKFNLSGDYEKDGALARRLLEKHPRYRPMIDGMLEDIARGDLMAAAALQGQLITHAGIDPYKLLPEMEYDILQYRGIDPEGLSPEQRSALVSDAEIAEFINRTVRVAFDIAAKFSAAGIDPAPAFWHWIFLQTGIFWNRNMENKKQPGRRQSFGHTPKPSLTTFNQGQFINFDTAIYRSKDPISMFVDRTGNVMPQNVLMDMLYHDKVIVAASSMRPLPEEVASSELQNGWPEFEHFENLPKKVTVDPVADHLKALEAELYEKIMALPEQAPGEPLFNQGAARMLAARLVNQAPPGAYVFVFLSGRWYVAKKSEWLKEQNLSFLKSMDWQDVTRVRGYGALLYNDENDKGQAIAEIYDQWEPQSEPDSMGRLTSVLQPTSTSLTLNGLPVQAEISEDGGLRLSAQGLTTIFVPLPMLEKGQVLGRANFQGVDKNFTDGISRNHFEVKAHRVDVQDPDEIMIQVLVRDLGSTNGTKLGGYKLTKEDPPRMLVEAVLPRANLRSEMRAAAAQAKFPLSLQESLDANRSLIQSELHGSFLYPELFVTFKVPLRSEVRGSDDFKGFRSRRDAERDRLTRRVFLAAGGLVSAGLLAAMAWRLTAGREDKIRKAVARRKAQGLLSVDAPWNHFPLEDSNLSEVEKIRRSLQVISDWLVQEGYGEAEILDEFSGYVETSRPAKDLGRSLMGKSYNSQSGQYTVEIQSHLLLELLRQVKQEQSKDLFILIFGGLIMRESLGLRLMLQSEDRLREISQKTGELERERRRLMPAGQLNSESPEFRLFLKRKLPEIDRLFTATLALEHLEAEWEWAFYDRAAQRGEYSESRLKELLAGMRGQSSGLNQYLNRHAYSSRLLIETQGDSFKIARSQLTGVTFNNYLLLRQGELTRDALNLPAANFLLSNYELVHEGIRYLPAGVNHPSAGIEPRILEMMGRGQWPGFEAFDSFARRLEPSLDQATAELYKEFPFFPRVVDAQRDNTVRVRMEKVQLELQESLERPKRPKRAIFDSDKEEKPAEKRGVGEAVLPLQKRSEMRAAVSDTVGAALARSELDNVGEGLAGYAYGRVTDEILSEVSVRLEQVRINHSDLSVEQIIDIIRDITLQKIKNLQTVARSNEITGKANTVRLKDIQLLMEIVRGHVLEDFNQLKGGFTVGTSLSPSDGKSMAMNLISALQTLRDAGAVKHALIVASADQRKILAEERAEQGLALDALELLNKLPGAGVLESQFENGQTRLPHARRADNPKETVSQLLVPVELLEDGGGLSAADSEMLEAVSVFLQLAAGAVIAREGSAAAEEIRGKLNQLLQIKGAEIDEKILNAVFQPRGAGFSLSQRGLLGVLQVLEAQYDGIMAMRTAA